MAGTVRISSQRIVSALLNQSQKYNGLLNIAATSSIFQKQVCANYLHKHTFIYAYNLTRATDWLGDVNLIKFALLFQVYFQICFKITLIKITRHNISFISIL